MQSKKLLFVKEKILFRDIHTKGKKSSLLVYAVCCLIVWVSFIQPVPRQIGFLELGYITIFCFIVYIWTIKNLMHGKFSIGSNRINAPLFCLFFLMLTSVGKSLHNGVYLHAWFRGIIPYFNLIIFYVLLTEIRTRKQLLTVILASFLSSISYAVQIYIELPVLIKSVLLKNASLLRASLGSNAFQPLLVSMLAFPLGVLSAKNIPNIRLWIVLQLILGGAAFLTLSRAILFLYVILAIIFGYHLLKHRGITKSRVFKFLLGFIICVCGLSLLSTFEIFQTIIYTFEQYFNRRFADPITQFLRSGRYIEWEAIIDLIKSQPFFGYGMGYDYEYFRENLGKWMHISYTHNVFSYILLHLGLIGIFVTLWLIYSIFKEVMTVGRIIGDNDLWIYRGLLYAMISLSFYIQLQSVYRHNSFVLQFVFILVSIVKLKDMSSSSRHIRLSRN